MDLIFWIFVIGGFAVVIGCVLAVVVLLSQIRSELRLLNSRQEGDTRAA